MLPLRVIGARNLHVVIFLPSTVETSMEKKHNGKEKVVSWETYAADVDRQRLV